MSIAALPRVDGRHRNKALAAARRTRAVELRCQGWTYGAIADELGYASRATVYAIVHKALAAQEACETEHLRELETERLDRLQAGLWDRAMAGDVAAVSEVRRIIEARVRLLGLTSKGGLEQEACVTVVCSCAPGIGHQRPSLAAF
ncbi:helix-turn-helix domain-containing protein [Knoellia sp. CPCC 206450]|uniref:helix-turn-helix domain-containing protein n=1 Tax=Knoellia tibetensis TaxID=3404798 RepID=UPI003B42B4A3